MTTTSFAQIFEAVITGVKASVEVNLNYSDWEELSIDERFLCKEEFKIGLIAFLEALPDVWLRHTDDSGSTVIYSYDLKLLANKIKEDWNGT